jgi:hypothetical protein
MMNYHGSTWMMYQFFKDFAGPIVTIVAAITAVIVTAYFACQQTGLFRTLQPASPITRRSSLDPVPYREMIP